MSHNARGHIRDLLDDGSNPPVHLGAGHILPSLAAHGSWEIVRHVNYFWFACSALENGSVARGDSQSDRLPYCFSGAGPNWMRIGGSTWENQSELWGLDETDERSN